MNKTLVYTLQVFFVYLVLTIASFLMFRMVYLYSSFEGNVGFLQQKQEYLPITIWKLSFYIHVFSSSFCLLAGFSQFSSTLLKEFPKAHRILGRIYVYNILFVNFIPAMIMAYYANGGVPSKIAFFILNFLWFGFTLRSLIAIKNKNIVLHKNDMIRSYALTFSAITLRTWNLILGNFTELDPTTIYMMNAWLGFVPNLIIAELIIYYKNRLLRRSSS
ncbi:MAG: DUF2306 domain-containing protein [Cytophagales bacterium]|nr:DUF2306 domain-containing protein [Cytophagales bacterium]